MNNEKAVRKFMICVQMIRRRYVEESEFLYCLSLLYIYIELITRHLDYFAVPNIMLYQHYTSIVL